MYLLILRFSDVSQHLWQFWLSTAWRLFIHWYFQARFPSLIVHPTS